jgi:hypothetical protein
MSLAARMKTAATILTEQGPTRLLRYTAHRLVEGYYERHFGVDTGSEVMLDTLGIHDSDAVRYSPTPYPAFFRAMRLVGADLPSSVFVDYGSGLGRIVMCAASLPLARVIGIEFADELVRRCNANLERARSRFACKDTVILHANAMTWRVLPEVNIFHFYNPFLGNTLRTTVSEIARSLRNVPREAWILFGSPWEMSRIMAAGEIIPAAWVRSSQDAPWPFHKEMTDKDPNGFRYRVYRIDSR